MAKNKKDLSLFDLLDENFNLEENNFDNQSMKQNKVFKITLEFHQGHFGIVNEFYSEKISLISSGLVYEKIPNFDYKDPVNSELYERNPYKIFVSNSRYLCKMCFDEFVKVFDEGFPEKIKGFDMAFYNIIYHFDNGEEVEYKSSGWMSENSFSKAHSYLEKILPVEVKLIC